MATTTGDTINGPFKALDFSHLAYVPGATASYNSATGVLTVTSGGYYESLTINNSGQSSFQTQSDGSGGTSVPGVGTNTIVITSQPTPVCFASGTLIRTARGDVAVEDLRVGDVAVTSSGKHRPIRWIGSRTMDPRRHPRPQDAQPVRIRAGAFAPGRPARDLRVSPGHALCLDVLGEVLVPAGALVDGATVVQEEVGRVTYWHVELDGHDLLLAEGVPAESYLDMGNRGFFAGSAVIDLAASPDAAPHSHAGFCRPFHAGGPVVEALRGRLRARAGAVGVAAEERRRQGPTG